MAADSHDIFRAPFCRRVIELLELPGQALGMLTEPVDVRIHARHEALGNLPGIGAVSCPLLLHVSAVEKEAACSVLLDECRTEDLSQLPKAAATPQIDLK